ncbi:hypothetical protein K502DRAFT_366847 [Neoconidiobolus thromboides FSU 785]|nr:hypothetical protein K502DRAFT_366847 [Neoconidiobolus thromboides FSU 785]
MANRVAIGELYSFINKKNGLKYVGNLIKIDASLRTISLGNVFHLGSEGRLGGGAHEIQPDLNEVVFMVFPSDEIFYFSREDPAYIEAAKKKVNDLNFGYSLFDAKPQSTFSYESIQQNNKPNQYNAIPQPESIPVQKVAEEKAELSAPTFVDPSAPSEQANTKPHYQKYNQNQNQSQYHNQNQHNQHQNQHNQHQNNYQNQNQNRKPYKGNYNKNNGNNTIPKTDFDFDAFNAQFSKSQIGKSSQTDSDQDNSNIDAKDFYNKKSSFFDNISCDAKDRLDSKDRRALVQQERFTNTETFGETFVQRNQGGRYNYRGNFRGGRGRGRGGYYNGRGERRGSSNAQ